MWTAYSRTKTKLLSKEPKKLAEARTIPELNAKLSEEQRRDCYYERKTNGKV